MVSLKKKDYFPDFTFGVDFIDVASGHTTMPNDGQDAVMGMVMVNVPIWHDRIKAGVNEAKNRLSSSEEMYTDVTNQVEFQVKDFHFQLKTAEDLIHLYQKTVIPQAEKSLEAAQSGYETGKVEFLNLIDSERLLLNFKISYFKSVVDYEKSVAALERTIGIRIEDFQENLRGMK